MTDTQARDIAFEQYAAESEAKWGTLPFSLIESRETFNTVRTVQRIASLRTVYPQYPNAHCRVIRDDEKGVYQFQIFDGAEFLEIVEYSIDRGLWFGREWLTASRSYI